MSSPQGKIILPADMIATIWLFSLLSTTMLREIECMYESPVIEYEVSDPFLSVEDMGDSVQMEKRTKPSLSIVNPLDVLRQRLMLEIARRQMRENSKQVELNRAILKNVGKRVNQLDVMDFHRLGKDQQKYEITNAQNNDDLHIKYLYSLKYNNV
ncbi:Diuretic hormone [Pseudolycoriella hygida]|uniref:Diuretic hormone n=1 Tax=Pseudolycoriella hygida TaxID=35572 RepID=A0A9Q0MNR1_9DIPT|nr:Diuretic hormone [Pseudolycoriella hygida]